MRTTLKLLQLSPYYRPEKWSSRHLGEDLQQGFVKAGHTIVVYAPTPTRGVTKEERRQYRKIKRETEENGAIVVRRFPLVGEGRNPLLRAFRYIWGECKFAWYGFWAKDVDVVDVGSTPPIHPLLGVFLKKTRGIPYVFTINDLFPESLLSSGITRKGSLLWKLGTLVTNSSCKNADALIVISKQIQKELLKRGIPEEKISLIYNWIDEQATQPVPREQNTLFDEFKLPRDKFYVGYAGNLGMSQNVGLLVDCAERLKDEPNIRFVIFGNGTEKEDLSKRIETLKLNNIVIHPMQPLERVSEVYSLSDVSLVACRRGVGKGAFPSKAATIMATATPTLVSFDAESDLVDVVTQNECGLCVEPENTDQAVDAIRKLFGDPDLCKRLGDNARKLVCERFAKEKAIAEYVRIFESCAKKRSNKKVD